MAKSLLKQQLKGLDLTKPPQGMSREKRRAMERDMEKNAKIISKLTPAQTKLIDMLASQKAEDLVHEMNILIDRSISALLINKFPEKTWDDIVQIQDELANLMEEDTKKWRKLGGVNMANKRIGEMANQVRQKSLELIGQGIKQKESIEILVTQFPELSKSMITNAYKKTVKEFNDKKEELETKDILKELFPDAAEEDLNEVCNIVTESKSEIPLEKYHNGEVGNMVENECIAEVVKENKEEVKLNNKLKVIKRVVEIEGEFGVYSVENGQVKNEGMIFESIDHMRKESGQLIEGLTKEIQDLQDKLKSAKLHKEELEEVFMMA